MSIMMIAILLAAAAAESIDGVKINDRIERYAIAGDTSRQLIRQMNQLGPLDHTTGKRMQGYLAWNVFWNFSYTMQSGNCVLTDVDVRLDVVITLPEWVPSARSDAALEQGWPDYVARLTEHEEGHRAIAIRAAKSVRDVLRTTPSRPACKEMDSFANQAAQAALQGYAQADNEYDRLTRHGETQGVRLP